MNNLDKQYQNLLQDILDNGVKKETRNGGTISVFGRHIRHNMSEGFPLLTTKKMAWKTMVTELLWFLRGDTNIKFLVDNDCHIWDGDAYKNYCNQIPDYSKQFTMSKEDYIDKIKTDDDFAKKWGELGPVYGKQWRKWGTGETVTVGHNGQHTLLGEKVVDQIQNLINDLKTNPDSRRLMVSAWNVGELDQMVLPPCHYGFQVYTRELSSGERRDWVIKNRSQKMPKFFDRLGWEGNVNEVLEAFNTPTRAISLMYNARSQDVPLGTPFNLASYGLLLMILAKEVNMVPEELISNMGDCHIYLNQIDGVREQLTREPYELPKLVIDQFDETNHYIGDMDDISEYNINQFKLENYQSHPSIKMPLSN